MQHLPLRLVRPLVLGALLLAGAPAALAAPDDPPATIDPSDKLRGGDGVGGIEKGSKGGSKGPSQPTGQNGSSSSTLFDSETAAWTDLGAALPGTATPALEGVGTGMPGTTIGLDLSGGPAFAPATLVLGTDTAPVHFKGGTLVPQPMLLVSLVTNAQGGLHLVSPLPPGGLPSGMTLCIQFWLVDPQGPKGLSASNALLFVAL